MLESWTDNVYAAGLHGDCAISRLRRSVQKRPRRQINVFRATNKRLSARTSDVLVPVDRALPPAGVHRSVPMRCPSNSLQAGRGSVLDKCVSGDGKIGHRESEGETRCNVDPTVNSGRCLVVSRAGSHGRRDVAELKAAQSKQRGDPGPSSPRGDGASNKLLHVRARVHPSNRRFFDFLLEARKQAKHPGQYDKYTRVSFSAACKPQPLHVSDQHARILDSVCPQRS